jgi:NitT/TauT family transport system permease protein
MRLRGALWRPSREVWISILSVVVVLALWEAAVDFNWLDSAFLVAPSAIVRATVELAVDGELFGHIRATLARMSVGFIVGSFLGLVVGLAMGWSKEIRAAVDPFVSVIYPLPKIALLPLIMLLVGIGEGPIVLVIALGAFFPVLVNSIAGVMSIDPIYFDVARNCGASRYKTFARVMLPGSLPMVLAGLRLALGLSLLLAVVVELSIATTGLGAMLWLSWETLRVERIYVAIAVIAALALLLNPLLSFVGRRLTPWLQEH